MYSVDLAALFFLRGLGKDFTLFGPQHKERLFGPKLGRLRLKTAASSAALEGCDTLLYWGDFINNPVYGLDDFSIRDVRMKFSPSFSAAFSRWKSLHLLEGAAKPRKVISVSNNFQTLPEFADRVESKEVEKVRRLMASNFDRFFPRDSESARLLRDFLPGAESKIEQAVDSAFLLNLEEAYPRLKSVRQEPVFAWSFWRSGFANVAPLLHKMESLTGLRPVEIEGWLKLSKKDPDGHYESCLRTMKAARFVMTDTYHVLVNALNLGKNVLGLGRRAAEQTGTLGDFKKRILLRDLGLEEGYCEFSDEAAEMPALAEKALRLKEQDLSRVLRLKQDYEARLAAEIG